MNGLIEQFGAMQIEEKTALFPVVDTKKMGWAKKRSTTQEIQRGAVVLGSVTAVSENFFLRRAEIYDLNAIDNDLLSIKKALKESRGQIALSQTLAPIWLKARLTYYLAHKKIKYLFSITQEKDCRVLQNWRAARVSDCQSATAEMAARLWEQIDQDITTHIQTYASYVGVAFKRSIAQMHMEVGGFMLQAASQLKNDTLCEKIMKRMKEIVLPEAVATMSSQSARDLVVSTSGSLAFNPFWLGRLYTWYWYPEADSVGKQIQTIAAQNAQLKIDIDAYRETLCTQGILSEMYEEAKRTCADLKARLDDCRNAFTKESSNLYAGPRNALVVEAANYAAGVSEALYDTRQHLELLEDLLSDKTHSFLYVLHAYYQFESVTKASEYEKIQKLFAFAELLESTKCFSDKHKIDKFIKSAMKSMREVVSVKGRVCVRLTDQEKKIYDEILLGMPLDSPKDGFPELFRSLMLKLLFEQKYFSTGKTPWELRVLLHILQKNDQYQIVWEISKKTHPDFLKRITPHISTDASLPGVSDLFMCIAKANQERDPFSYAASWKLLCDYANISIEETLIQIAYDKLIEVQKKHDYIVMSPKVSFEFRKGGIIAYPLDDFGPDNLGELKGIERVGLLSLALVSSLSGDAAASKLVTRILEDARSSEFFDSTGDNLLMAFENTCEKIKSGKFAFTVPTDDGSNEIGPNEWGLFINGPLKPYLRGKTTFSMKEIGFQKALYSLVKYEARGSSKKITEALTQSLGADDFANWCKDMSTL
jgi:hypothetical protein